MEVSTRTLNALLDGAVTRTLVKVGHIPGTISQRKAESIYGKWFIDAVRARRITPVSIGEGTNGKKEYSINAITALQASDMLAADVQLKNV